MSRWPDAHRPTNAFLKRCRDAQIPKPLGEICHFDIMIGHLSYISFNFFQIFKFQIALQCWNLSLWSPSSERWTETLLQTDTPIIPVVNVVTDSRSVFFSACFLSPFFLSFFFFLFFFFYFTGNSMKWGMTLPPCPCSVCSAKVWLDKCVGRWRCTLWGYVTEFHMQVHTQKLLCFLSASHMLKAIV